MTGTHGSPVGVGENLGCYKKSENSTRDCKGQLSDRSIQHKTSRQSPDIYFSPIPLTDSRMALSDPLPTPPATPEPAKAERQKLKLEPKHVEHLTKAFLDAPYIRAQLYRKRKDGLESSRDAKPQVHSQKMPVKLRGIAVVNPKIKGSPCQFMTHGYAGSTNILKSFHRSFLNAPYGEEFENDCCFRVKPAEGGCTVSMSITNEILNRWTGKAIYDLVAELDVTEQVTKAVLGELAAQSDLSVDDIEIRTPGSENSGEDDSESVDWYALADTLLAESEMDSLVDTASELFSRLDEASCTAHTHMLLTNLTTLKQKHQDIIFVKIRTQEISADGTAARIGIPWISHHFEWKLHDQMKLPEPERRDFRMRLIDLVAKKAFQKDPALVKPFAQNVTLNGDGVRVFCAPLEDIVGGDDEVWACFVSGCVKS
jgi:hypothetical protein